MLNQILRNNYNIHNTLELALSGLSISEFALSELALSELALS